MSYVGSFSQLGIGSGLKLDDMLTELRKVENQRLVPYTNKQTSCESQISTWGEIKSALSDLQASAKALTGSAFNTFTTNETKNFTATCSSNAMAGVNSVSVHQLASASSVGTKTAMDSSSEAIGSGASTITITQADGSQIKVELEDGQSSLDAIKDKINKQNGDVTASVVRDDDGYHLQLISRKTGKENAISDITVDGNTDLESALNYDAADSTGNGNMETITTAQDAIVAVNGKTYTRASNSINDIIPGVTLALSSVSSSHQDEKGETVYDSEQLILTQDNSAVKDAIKNFVEKYNALNKKINDARSITDGGDDDSDSQKTASSSSDDPFANDGTSGPLANDSALRDLSSLIFGDVAGAYTGMGNADVSALSDIGIEIDSKTGEMTLKDSDLDDALENNPDQIQKMFVGNDSVSGLASSLEETATKYLGDDDKNIKGVIADTTKGLNDQLKQLKDQIAKTQELIDSQMETYTKQFQNLDAMMTKMQSTSQSLLSALSGI